MKYTFSDLVEDLNIGMEVEFYYHNNRYSISNNEKGWYFTKYGEINYYSFNNVEELLQMVRIDSLKLEEIWDKVEF